MFVKEKKIGGKFMKGTYIFEYFDGNEFKKIEKALKKYNMLAYKKLLFDFYPALKKGEFLGKLTAKNSKDKTEKYELTLPSDNMFTKVHGETKLMYTVYTDQKMIMLETITPEDILAEGHKSELATYKGVMISKENQAKDMFKIELLNMLNVDK